MQSTAGHLELKHSMWETYQHLAAFLGATTRFSLDSAGNLPKAIGSLENLELGSTLALAFWSATGWFVAMRWRCGGDANQGSKDHF